MVYCVLRTPVSVHPDDKPMRANPQTAATSDKPIYYPDTDGKPMGESDLHRDIMFRIIHLLQRYVTVVRGCSWII